MWQRAQDDPDTYDADSTPEPLLLPEEKSVS